jgi:hypothetical protein
MTIHAAMRYFAIVLIVFGGSIAATIVGIWLTRRGWRGLFGGD